MRRPLTPLLAYTLLCNALAASAALAANPDSALLAQGRHLVENIGLCADCHTPRLPGGEFDRARWLQGAPIEFKPLVAMPWSPVAPPIAGLPGYTDEQAIRFLMTGERPGGAPVLPPMPAYRFTRAEAEAVLAYLRALKPAP